MREMGDAMMAQRRPQGVMDLAGWAQFVTKVGVTGVLALYGFYLIAQTFTSALAAHAMESRRDMGRQLHVLQQICVNTGATADDRSKCLSWSFDEK